MSLDTETLALSLINYFFTY